MKHYLLDNLLNIVIIIMLSYLCFQITELKINNDVYQQIEALHTSVIVLNAELDTAVDKMNTIGVNMGVAKQQQDILLGSIGDYINDWNKTSQ